MLSDLCGYSILHVFQYLTSRRLLLLAAHSIAPQERLEQLRMLVPLGAGVHAQADVPDASRICVHVALGFHPGGRGSGQGWAGLGTRTGEHGWF